MDENLNLEGNIDTKNLLSFYKQKFFVTSN